MGMAIEMAGLQSMHTLGMDERGIHIDKQSSKDFNRPQYQAAVEAMEKSNIGRLRNMK